jgi:dTDP-glucose 4,6-dehydratase
MAERHPSLRLTVFDSLSYAGTLDPLEDLIETGRVDFVQADVADRHQVQRALEPCEAVANFAAQSHVDRSIVDATPFMQTNAIGVQCILDSLRELGGKRRYVQISTDEVHGDAPPNRWFTEEDKTHPSNPYSASKAAADGLVLSYVRTHGIDAVITRCTNNYGPWQYPEKLVAMCITSLMEGRKIPIHGDGQMLRDWIHVEDHCDAIERVLQRGVTGQIYNVAGLCEITTLDIVKMVSEQFGKKLDRVVERIPDRPGNDRRYAISPGKIMSALGWRPGLSFKERLPALIEWYREHRPWWSRIMDTPHYRLHVKKIKVGL